LSGCHVAGLGKILLYQPSSKVALPSSLSPAASRDERLLSILFARVASKMYEHSTSEEEGEILSDFGKKRKIAIADRRKILVRDPFFLVYR